MKQTAVEWLYEILHKQNYIYEDMSEYLKQAKEMEKEQSRDYAEFAIRCDRLGMKILNFDGYMNLENKETFKNK